MTTNAAEAATAPVVSASSSITRALARGVGVGGVVFAGLALTDFHRQFATISPVWDFAFASVYLLGDGGARGELLGGAGPHDADARRASSPACTCWV